MRKDLLTQNSNDFMKNFEDHPTCKASMNQFPNGYRLYVRNECLKFFETINSQEYIDKKVDSPI